MVDKSEKLWFVYMIRTDGGQLYTGITTDMQRRWQEHAHGKAGARYFRIHKPQRLCFLEQHINRSSASVREAMIKRLSKAQKELLVDAHEIPVQVFSIDANADQDNNP